jgi:putative FmdB family regulatory protein
MPTYSYRCTACGHQFDKFQRFTEDTLTECPECLGLIKRVVQPVGVVFKGSGWYITDSRKPSTSENGGSEKAAKSDAKDSKEAATAKSGDGKSSESKSSESTEAPKPKAAATAEV